MFKVNYMNVTIWILASLMICIFMGSIIWRMKTKNVNDQKGVLIKVSNQIIDLSQSISSTFQISSIVNILFKNRFARNKYSVIPMLSFFKNNAYLICNPVFVKNIEKIEINNKILNVLCTKNSKLVDLKNIYEISRHFDSEKLQVKIIVPATFKWQSIDNHLYVMPIHEIGNYIFNDSDKLNQENVYPIIKKIKELNIFKKTTTKRGKYV